MILDIEPRPVRAMEVLNFRIALRNYREPDSIVIDLSMPEMPMGSNQVVLKKTGKGAFSEEGIIPVCPSGKKLWKAGIIINGRLEGGFLFNVGY